MAGEDPRPYPQLVLQDAYDQAAWLRVCKRLPALEAQIQASLRLHPGMEALARDLFVFFFKYTYTEAKIKSSQEGRLVLARQTLGWVRSAQDFALLRAETVLDEARSGFAVQQVLTQVERALRNPLWFSGEDLLQNFAMEETERKLEDLEDQLEVVKELQEQSGEENPSLEKAKAALTQEADQAAQQAQDAKEAAQQALDALPAEVQSKLRDLTNALPQRMEQSEQALDDFHSQMGTGSGQTGDAASRLALGERLLRLDKLQRLAKLVGALRHFARSQRNAVMERTGTEVHAIDRGQDLARLLPSEVVALRHPARRKLFLRRYLEGDLLQYAIQGKNKGAKGPMVVCVDGSGSMQGDKELWAKGVCLTLMEIARKQRRHFRAVVFSGRHRDLRVFDLLQAPDTGQLQGAPVEMDDLIDFAEYFPAGGTDFEGPLNRALELLEEKNLRRGDIILITDGEAHLSPAWKQSFLETKEELGFKLYGILVDVGQRGKLRPGPLRDIADQITSIEHLKAESVKDLFIKL